MDPLSRRARATGPASSPPTSRSSARLYRESWGDPVIRWLFSTVSTRWSSTTTTCTTTGISRGRGWRRCARPTGGPSRRSSQGSCPTGSISTSATSRPHTSRRTSNTGRRESSTTRGRCSAHFVRRTDEHSEGTRWSFVRDLDGSRLIVLDDRTGRVLEEGRRSIFDDERVAVDHRADAGRLQAPHVRHLRSASCSRRACTTSRPGTSRSATERWGDGPRKLGERMRRAVDFDHWASFACPSSA